MRKIKKYRSKQDQIKLESIHPMQIFYNKYDNQRLTKDCDIFQAINMISTNKCTTDENKS